MRPGRVVALGLDGAGWELLGPWLAQGRLPHLAHLISQGCSAPLQSIIPPATCPGWRCYSTAKNPGQLGVFWWTGWDRDSGRLTFPNAHSFHSPDFWDYLGAAGKRVAIINMPTTYPPQPVNGVMVSGFGAPLDRNLRPLLERLTYPEDWWPRLRQDYNYRVAMSGVDLGDKAQVAAEITDLIRLRFRLLLDLLHSGQYDFLHLTIFYINTLQHFYGADEVVAQAWELIDWFIGQLLETDGYLFIFSDHGTMKIEHSFWINNWLISEGYLKLKPDFGDIIGRLDDWGQRRLSWKKRYLSALAQAALPVRWQDRLPGMYRLLKGNMIDQKLDWPASAAISLSQGVIYINRQQVGADYERLRDELSHKLKLLRLPVDNRGVIDQVRKSEEVYSGDYLHQAPDLVALPARGVEIYGGIGSEVFESRERSWSSGNHLEGIFIAHGKGIAHKRLKHASLLDISPSIMHLLDVPIPEDMDGRVLQHIFQPQSYWASKGIKYQSPWQQPTQPTGEGDDNQSLREELTSLGYLD